MKKRIFILFAFLVAFGLKAQDTTRIIIGGKTIMIIGKTGHNEEINVDKILDSLHIDKIDIDRSDTDSLNEEEIENLVGRHLKFEDRIEKEVEREIEREMAKVFEKIENEEVEIKILDSEDDDDDDFETDGFDKSIAHWSGFEAGVNGWMNSDNTFGLENSAYNLDYSNSIFVNLNIAEQKIPFFKGYGGLVTGLGFNFNSFAFKPNTTLNYNEDYTTASIDSIVSFKKNKLNVTYLTLPLMLEFNTSLDQDKSFHFGFGVQGGFKLLAKTKQKYELSGEKYKTKVRGHYNINPWKADAIARIGYKNLTFFANYPLTQFFEKDAGPEMYTFQVGLRIIDFD